ncbi:STAS-like domain-containing protein [Mesorhizobium sp. 1B3]|uniref:STAS-like domain-containing protein n=1 Tax=Mesorhizobium sp. 1B3 TaxID=3243599 RepID=UPI003D983140
MDRTISIARDYTTYPGPRYAADGPFSGETFRDTILARALQEAITSGGVVTVVLDDVAGYGSSFLEEAFGGLIRKGFDRSQIKRHLRVVAQTNRFQHHARTAQRYIDEAAPITVQ